MIAPLVSLPSGRQSANICLKKRSCISNVSKLTSFWSILRTEEAQGCKCSTCMPRESAFWSVDVVHLCWWGHAQYPGFIAPYSGHERFLTVSSSHVSQFFKAMMRGCKSPEESLVGPKTGKMSMASINDIDFLQACNDGWAWTVIPFYVEEPCFDI